MKEFSLEIITPSKAAFTKNVTSVTVPGTKGNFQILYNHAPIISSLDVGEINIVENGNKVANFATSGGTIEVFNNKVIILVETFERADQIDLKRAEESKKRAQERLRLEKRKEFDQLRAEIALKKAINRIKIVSKRL